MTENVKPVSAPKNNQTPEPFHPDGDVAPAAPQKPQQQKTPCVEFPPCQ